MTRGKSRDPDVRGRKALVIGYGRSGRAAASFISKQGGTVRVVDRADTPELRADLEQAGIHARLGGYGPEDLNGTDLVVVSPGVAWDAPLVETARQRGIAVTSEIDLFFRACPARIAGITGTNGKTTTTALTAEVLRAGGLHVMRGGNIGEPVLDRIDQLGTDDWVVLELSSFQLESIEHPRLRVGVVLNVTPDHLDRHKSFEHYVELKTRAVAYMEPDDHAVLNLDDPACAAMRSQTRGHVVGFGLQRPVGQGVTVRDGWITIAGAGSDTRVLPAAEVPLPGEHNLSNVMAAVGAGYAAGVAPERMGQAVRQFKAVEHRLEPIGTFGGARWYNDSKATNPDSTYKALAAFSEPIVLIAGGRNKGIDLEPLAQAIASRVEALVTIGETGEELARRVREAGLQHVQRATDLTDAVRKAAALARPGSVVLLSPAFTSYDMFRDYEDRGRRFKSTVLAELGR
ncbi:MAG TPA: UDP-N-acetylmuramoyl-L-alanine--D-glutamate ligase [Candidatus Dormibacteraeota bacterium]|jgi:UDP-N-acetylmuramoylalanine--D-glutamate ligase|nr:UDP-N-acetylmuramoyl-L-alanine--D-glutamate ligase [Candidatus Dormibacteraeota bacterium]